MARASFTGQYPMKIDAKGRMSIPSRFRDVLQKKDPDCDVGQAPGLYVLFGPYLENHLEIYSVDAFDEITERVEDLEYGSEEYDYAAENILGASVRLEVLDGGRIVLPKDQREKLGLTGGETSEELMLVGAGTHFKLWPVAEFDARKDRLESWRQAQGENFNPMKLLNRKPRPAAGD